MKLIYISPTSWKQPLGGRTSIVNFNSHTLCREHCALKHRERRRIRLFSEGTFDITDDITINSARELRIPKEHQEAIRKALHSRNRYFVVEVLDAKGITPIPMSGNKDFDRSVKDSMQLTAEKRRMRLAKATKLPKVSKVVSYQYERNPDVVAEALIRANGKCQLCKKPAPFIRASDDSLYLEVHHVVMLANGGTDTIDNTIAVCPNCHRKSHFGIMDTAK